MSHHLIVFNKKGYKWMLVVSVSSRGQNETSHHTPFLLPIHFHYVFLFLPLLWWNNLKNMYISPPFSLVLPWSQIRHFYGPGWFVLLRSSTGIPPLFLPLSINSCGSLPCIPSSSFQTSLLSVCSCHGQILNYAPMGDVCSSTWLQTHNWEHRRNLYSMYTQRHVDV